jgi:hypothetical protein
MSKDSASGGEDLAEMTGRPEQDLKEHGVNPGWMNRFTFKLTLWLVLVNAILAMLLTFSLYKSRAYYEHLAVIWTQNTSKILNVSTYKTFDKLDIGLSAVGHEAERQLQEGGIHGDVLNAYIKQQSAQLPELHGLRVSDAEGNLKYGADFSETWVNISDRSYFQHLRDHPKEELAVSELIQGRVSGKWSLALARPIHRRDGTFAGIVLGLFAVEYFDRAFPQLDIGGQGAIGIRDLGLRLVALHPKGDEPGGQIGTSVVSQKTRDATQANPLTATYRAVFARDQKERVTTFRKVDKYPLYVFAASAPSDYLVPWRREATIELALLGTFILATILFRRVILKSRATERARSEAVRYGEELQRRNEALNAALSRVKRLEGTISICSYCKKIRTEQQSWEALETYFAEHSDAMFTHGACPECAKEQKDLYRAFKRNLS